MKKFLTVLLVIAVMFTFSFGTAMAYTGNGYDLAGARAVIDKAYQNATATDFDVDYDAVNTTANDYTSFTIGKNFVQSGIYAAYQEYKKALTGSDITTIAGATLSAGDSEAVDVAKVKVALETAAVDGGAYVNDTYAAAFDAFKAELTSVVNAISTDAYTTTNYEDLGLSAGFTAKNGTTYNTSKEAAEADKQWALDAIAKAKFDASIGTSEIARTDDTWKVKSYADLYANVFGQVFTLVENKDDVLDANKVTSVSYKMSNSTYSTTAMEKADSATLAVKKAQAKANLVAMVTSFEVGSSYKASYDNALAAYQEAMNYLIDSATKEAELPALGTAITAATATTVKIDNGTPVDYIQVTADAAQAKADAASNKQVATIQGKFYDDTKADAALVEVLREIYKNHAYNSATQTANNKTLYSAFEALTPGQKAELKAARDYSEVEADANGKYTFKTYNTGVEDDAVYYEKEFEAVKAAVDAYCAAVDAATTSLDVDKAEKAFKEATLEKNIKKATSVDAIFTSYANGMLNAYWTNTVNRSGNYPIYVTWDGGKSYKSNYNDNDFVKFAIAKGARTVKEADALYTEGCALIDAYKTKTQLAAEASAVQAKIAALPTTITLADKAAVIDAYNAYAALADDYKTYVANASTLKNAVVKLERLEAAEVVKLINALPAKVTVADKAAVKAADEARKAWKKEEAYNDTTMVASRTSVPELTTQKAAVKAAELQAIKDAYTPLKAKWDVDKLTADDAVAIKALQDAVDAYIAEYQEAVPYEATIAKMTAAVEALKNKSVEELKLTAKSFAKKGSITVKWTVKGDASAADGYQVWKSTKQSKGYKKAITTTKKSYKNTKGLKKGTRYYYKVRAYKVVDGKKVYSDWSNKAYRVAK